MLTPSPTERCVSYFFVAFLSRHQFAGNYGEDYQDLQTLIQDSRSLQCAMAALSCLSTDRSERRSSSTPSSTVSFRHYQEAVSLLRSELRKIDRNHTLMTDSVLWTTLLLSIFELMHDASGHGFNVHFVQGTSMLLGRKSPKYFLQRRKLPFLRLARALELMRAVAYWDNTYFEDAHWRSAIDDTITEGSPLCGSLALEAIYKIVGAFTRLKSLAKGIVCSKQPQDLDEAQNTFLQQTANEAWYLHESLQLWYSTAVCHPAGIWASHHRPEHSSEATSTCEDDRPSRLTADPQLLLSLLYYHALSLNIPSMFKQHPHYAYMDISAPISTTQEIQSHVSNIVRLSESALRLGSFAEVQLLWPVRAAGTHCADITMSDRVLEILTQVDRSGFAIARRFKDDLFRHWRKTGLR